MPSSMVWRICCCSCGRRRKQLKGHCPQKEMKTAIMLLLYDLLLAGCIMDWMESSIRCCSYYLSDLAPKEEEEIHFMGFKWGTGLKFTIFIGIEDDLLIITTIWCWWWTRNRGNKLIICLSFACSPHEKLPLLGKENNLRVTHEGTRWWSWRQE